MGTNFSKHAFPHKMGIRIKWEQFWNLNARQYELHNQNVLNYFEKKRKMKDLLIINLGMESTKPINQQWNRITEFLGCPNVSKPLPIHNSANAKRANQIDFFPKNYTIKW